jgi:hypothetical protein
VGPVQCRRQARARCVSRPRSSRPPVACV